MFQLFFERRLEGSLVGCFYSGSGVTRMIEPGGCVFEFGPCAVVGWGPVILLLLLLVLCFRGLARVLPGRSDMCKLFFSNLSFGEM